jgi:hypothetical protein
MMFTHGAAESSPSGGAASIGVPSGATASGSAASSGTPTVPMPQTTSPWGSLGDVVGKAISSANAVNDLQNNIQRNETEKIRTYREWVAAQKDYNELPESAKKGREAQDILDMSDPVRRAANEAEYKSKGYGSSGTSTNTAARLASSVG